MSERSGGSGGYDESPDSRPHEHIQPRCKPWHDHESDARIAHPRECSMKCIAYVGLSGLRRCGYLRDQMHNDNPREGNRLYKYGWTGGSRSKRPTEVRYYGSREPTRHCKAL